MVAYAQFSTLMFGGAQQQWKLISITASGREIYEVICIRFEVDAIKCLTDRLQTRSSIESGQSVISYLQTYSGQMMFVTTVINIVKNLDDYTSVETWKW